MTPTIGRIVHYRLSRDDVDSIAERMEELPPNLRPIPSVGDVLPMIVVRVHGRGEHSPVNGQVFLDGDGLLHVGGVLPGQGPGTWSWPPAAMPSAPIGVGYGDRI